MPDHITEEKDGWVCWTSDAFPAEVWVRYEPGADNRSIRSELHLIATGDEEIGPALLRRLPAARIDSMARVLLRSKAIARHPAFSESNEAALKFDVPEGRDHGDDFYRRVATAYTVAAQRSHAPARMLAEVNGVTAKTVHRWVERARNRGFLPSTTRGKAI